MLRPQSFAFHVTYTCPLKCAHCCFHSGPENKFRLAIGTILDFIDHLEDSIEMVAFTGGEPFLLGEQLVTAVEKAAKRGFVTRVVTSAYFGGNREAARKRLFALRQVGLRELSISWDDFHEEFVPFSAIKNTFEIGRELGLLVAINVVQSGRSKWNAQRLRSELSLSDDDESIICESPLNRTGRASDELQQHELSAARSVGPCPYVLTGPTLSAKGDLLACCGVIPNDSRLTIAHAARGDQLASALDTAKQSTLLNWLFLRGPYDIVQFIGDNFAVEIPAERNVGGNCEACAILFGNAAIAQRIDEALALKAHEIAGELSVLQALEWLDPQSVLSLWSRRTHIDTRRLHA
jgi:hypothetical protein